MIQFFKAAIRNFHFWGILVVPVDQNIESEVRDRPAHFNDIFHFFKLSCLKDTWRCGNVSVCGYMRLIVLCLVLYHQTTEQLLSSSCETPQFILSAVPSKRL